MTISELKNKLRESLPNHKITLKGYDRKMRWYELWSAPPPKTTYITKKVMGRIDEKIIEQLSAHLR